MQEEYRKVNGFPNYSISNLGNVRNDLTNIILKTSLDKDGYKFLELANNKKGYTRRIHRLVALTFIPNPNNKPIIDHINGNRTDNNINNLRWATIKENCQNTKMSSRNTSGYKGVSFDKDRNKWRARIKHNNKNLSLGYFNTKEEAANARYNKAKEIFGEFLNECEKPIIVNINIEQVVINN